MKKGYAMKNITAVLMAACFSTGSALALEMTSPDIRQGEPMQQKQVFDGFGCSGENLSPELTWRDVPEGTKSFALMVHDPDAPTGSGWWHWVVFNIPPDTKKIEENTTPPGVQGCNTNGENKYIGPCPPDREHRYFFKFFALDSTLPLQKGVSKKEVEEAMQGHVLDKCELMGRYEKKGEF